MTSIPESTADTQELFGIKTGFDVPLWKKAEEHVPEKDPNYCFHLKTTHAILAGLAFNRRTLITGYHGTGKSTHIEQVASRLQWPCIRVNLDGHIARTDLIGKEGIVIKEGKQVTEFKPGIIPWAIQKPMILVLDEYDAARPDVMFIIQRLLESEGKLTLLDQNKVLTPHPYFRLFATSNTIGLGDASGMYHGTQLVNQGQMDRWNMVVRLDYVEEEDEVAMILKKVPELANQYEMLVKMVRMAGLTRQGLAAGDISTVMSPRAVLTWAENFRIFEDISEAFCISFLNKCEEQEHALIAEYYQRCFDQPPVALKEAI